MSPVEITNLAMPATVFVYVVTLGTMLSTYCFVVERVVLSAQA